MKPRLEPGDARADGDQVPATFACPWCAAQIHEDTEASACIACGDSLVVCGRYRVAGHVDRTVFRGVRVTDKHPVAIKILAPPEDDDWTAWELFERSCKVLEQLHHTALPKVYGFERTDKGRLVLVREDFDGGTLEERVRDADDRLSREQVTKLLGDLLELLIYLQDRVPPIIHRDIKPSNIMFRGKESLSPVLVDFDTIVSRRSGLTIVGTPGYAPPEQFAAEAVPASDVYGVGATMLFVATHIEPDDLPRVAGRFDVGQKLASLGEDLSRVVLRMVEPDLSKRYATASAARDDLRARPTRHKKDRVPVEPAPLPAATPLPTAKKTRRWIWILGAGAFALGAVRAMQKEEARKKGLALAGNGSGATSSDDSKGTAALEKACREGGGQACFDLGDIWDNGKDGRAEDHTRAMLFFDLGCQHDHADSCNNLGAGYSKGVGAVKDVAKAASLYEKACKLKSPLGCSNLAWFYEEGQALPKDLKRALEYRDRSCDLGNGQACNLAGVMYEDGRGVAAPDDRKAASYYGLACDHGYAWGCRNYGIAYRDGQGVDNDDRRAVSLFKRACDADESDACDLLGRMVAKGSGVEKDPARAATLFDDACNKKTMRACDALGELYARGEGVKVDPKRAAALFDQACDAGVASGCGNLAGTVTDPARAAALRADACDGGDAKSCKKR